MNPYCLLFLVTDVVAIAGILATTTSRTNNKNKMNNHFDSDSENSKSNIMIRTKTSKINTT